MRGGTLQSLHRFRCVSQALRQASAAQLQQQQQPAGYIKQTAHSKYQGVRQACTRRGSRQMIIVKHNADTVLGNPDAEHMQCKQQVSFQYLHTRPHDAHCMVLFKGFVILYCMQLLLLGIVLNCSVPCSTGQSTSP